MQKGLYVSPYRSSLHYICIKWGSSRIKDSELSVNFVYVFGNTVIKFTAYIFKMLKSITF